MLLWFEVTLCDREAPDPVDVTMMMKDWTLLSWMCVIVLDCCHCLLMAAADCSFMMKVSPPI